MKWYWVKANAGTVGNETANQLAKERCRPRNSRYPSKDVGTVYKNKDKPQNTQYVAENMG